MNLAIQPFLELYEKTGEDYWLAPAALQCMHGHALMPEVVEQYVKQLLVGVIEKGSRAKSKAVKRGRHKKYLARMRELIFLTGTGPDDAAERIVVSDEKRGLKPPTQGSLMNWWNNKPAQLKVPMTVEDLAPIDVERVRIMENTYPEFSTYATGKPLRVRQKILDQIPDRNPVLEIVRAEAKRTGATFKE